MYGRFFLYPSPFHFSIIVSCCVFFCSSMEPGKSPFVLIHDVLLPCKKTENYLWPFRHSNDRHYPIRLAANFSTAIDHHCHSCLSSDRQDWTATWPQVCKIFTKCTTAVKTKRHYSFFLWHTHQHSNPCLVRTTQCCRLFQKRFRAVNKEWCTNIINFLFTKKNKH